MWHGYILVKNISLTTTEFNELLSNFRLVGDNNSEIANRRNHWRTSLDGSMIIFEAFFQKANISVGSFKQRLSTIKRIPIGRISHSIETIVLDRQISQVASYFQDSDILIQVIDFSVGRIREDSRIECIKYLSENVEEWEIEINGI